MAIQTLEQIRKEKIWNEVKAILNKYGVNFAPQVTMSPGGMAFTIEIVDVPAHSLSGGKADA